MRFSVICNTYNRADCLTLLLQALELQTYRDFEVIVVNGPSTDHTEDVIAGYAGRVRGFRCPKTNLSMSRNIGVAHAAGEVCTFIDDDGVPEPTWLADMHAGFTGPEVAAVGGLVYDHTGCRVQYRANAADRLGNARFDIGWPLTAYQMPGADPFLYLPGGNTSYRRAALVEVGGFDEEIEYYLDETDVCMRLTDLGYRLHMSDRAAMLHKSAPSHVRNEKRVVRRPYAVVKNKIYFALQSAARSGRPAADALRDGVAFADYFLKEGANWRENELLTAAEYEAFQADVERAVRDGTERGLTARRKSATLPPADESQFLPFNPAVADRRLAVAFISSNYPPELLGGIGRFTHETAMGLSMAGHEVHVVCRADDDGGHTTLDLEDGVWVHRVPMLWDGPWARPDMSEPVRRVLGWAAAAHLEIKRLADTRRIDLVSAPVWDSEGLFCHLDDDLKTVLTLHTTIKTTADLTPAWRIDPGIQELIDIERLVVTHATHVTAPSHDIRNKVYRDYAPAADVKVIYHGLPDRSADYLPREPDGKVRVLTVGRLERRKGTDLFLEAAALLAAELPEAEFVLVGDDAIPMDGRPHTTYRAEFERRHGRADWFDRVVFRGKVTEDELYAEYAACDVFCLPARYESFGLVLVEAMMFGKPVVAAAAGGMPEVVADGLAGHLAYPNNLASLVEHLRPLIEDGALRARLGKAARKRYETEFRLEAMVRNTVREYTRMVDAFAA